jgi:hypothetical protein
VKPAATTYTVTLRALSGPAWRAPAVKRLAMALKLLLRSFGLKATSVSDAKVNVRDHSDHALGKTECLTTKQVVEQSVPLPERVRTECPSTFPINGNPPPASSLVGHATFSDSSTGADLLNRQQSTND